MSNPYIQKDINKFKGCTALISRGALGSSSDKYSRDPSIFGITRINDTQYTSEDIVGVSVNGNRRNRVHFNEELVLIAVKAGATIVADTKYHRNRPFNIGEKELYTFLTNLGMTATNTQFCTKFIKV